jgi:hypothetical protein
MGKGHAVLKGTPVPEVRKDPVTVASPPKRKGGPPGNLKSLKHGAYSARLSAEEEQERTRFESQLISDLAGDVSTAQQALIRRASFLEIRLRRCERADSEGLHIADEHVLAWINSQRLLLTALGLKKIRNSGPSLQEYLQQKTEKGGISTCTN